MKNVKAAVCTKCGETYEAGRETYTCATCGGILEIEYNYNYIKSQVSREKLSAKKDFSMWRYMELLPI